MKKNYFNNIDIYIDIIHIYIFLHTYWTKEAHTVKYILHTFIYIFISQKSNSSEAEDD